MRVVNVVQLCQTVLNCVQLFNPKLVAEGFCVFPLAVRTRTRDDHGQPIAQQRVTRQPNASPQGAVTIVFAAAPTITICFNLAGILAKKHAQRLLPFASLFTSCPRIAAVAKQRRSRIEFNPHPGRPPSVTTEQVHTTRRLLWPCAVLRHLIHTRYAQPLRSFQDASGLNG